MAYIKEITLHNFKSFGKRVTVSFPKGLTVIVGPNGSGKSNIIDAVCFVLGRRSSKSMRADRLADLIFNGGNGKAPADFTEVNLIFDNTDRAFPIDSSVVAVSRKVTRDGYCVYRLNDHIATRTEIIEMLSHATINPDGYNIIMQGDIVKLVETDSLERRRIIDEVSGIAEYDEKKEKALRELEKVKDNIDKINIIISEVETQLLKLKDEREDALKYKELQIKLEETNGQLLNLKLSDEKNALAHLSNTLATIEADYQKFSQELQTLVLSSQEIEQKLNQLNQTIVQKAEKDQLALKNEIEEIKGTIHRAQESVNFTEGELKKTLSTIKETETRFQQIESEIYQLQQKLIQLETQRSELILQIENKSKELEEITKTISKIDLELATLNEKLSQLNIQFDQKRSRSFEIQNEMKQLQEILQLKCTERDSILSKTEQLKIQLNQLETEYAKAMEKQSSHKNRKLRVETNLNKLAKQEELYLREKLATIEEELQKVQEECTQIETELKTLKEISYPKAINEILNARDNGLLTGIYDIVAELIKVSPEYETAIEVAARLKLQYIVVETDDDASKAINFLKEKRIGQATFLPLNKIDIKPPNPQAIEACKTDGVIGLVVNLLEFDPKFEPAINYVFRDTIVVNNLETARKLPNGLRIVALDGDLIDANGAITGGFYQKKGIKLKQKEDSLKSIQTKISQLKNSRQETLSELEKLDNFVKELTQEKINIEIELTNQTLCINNICSQIKNLENDITESKTQIVKILEGIKSIENKYSSFVMESAQLKSELEQLEKEKIEIKEKLDSPKVSEYTAKAREVENIIYQLRESQQKLNGEIDSFKTKIESVLQPSLQSYKNDLANYYEKAERLKQTIQQNQALILLQSQQLGLKVNAVNEIAKDIETLRAERDRYQQVLFELSPKRDELYQKIANIQTTRSNLNAEKMAHENKINELLIEAQKYQHLALLPTDAKISDFEQKIRDIEIEMKRLEPINMRAIEDYESTSQRYEKLTEQNKKLIEERNAILKLMEEIDERKLAVFMEAFNAINYNFKEIFAQLSPGGEAEIMLENYANPFEGGLEIRAKPAGKEIRSLESMSGGEKTLTALSFIFALARYRPAPFYLLDEADMFLDGDNGEKFANLLKSFSKDAQFITVSFRESMMSSADQLIGVAMQETGSSDIVSVKIGGQ